jgi:nucleoside-diphosphate-sugar epimerase
MDNYRILITGGAGFIGSSLADYLLDNTSSEVVLVDNLSTGHIGNVRTHERLHFIKCDVNDYNDISGVILAGKFDYVFHYAAVVGVQRTLANPCKVLDDIQGLKNMLQLSKNAGVKRIFFASSSEVYGEPVHLPQHEHNTPLNSRLPYAIVKNVGEAFCKSYYQEYNLPYTIFRFFNTYGPKQSPDFVISRFLKAALENRDITIYGNGQQTRTFCYIQDNAEACFNSLKTGLFENDVVNIGSNVEVTVQELASKIISVVGSSSKIVYLPALPEGDMTRRQPDVSNMKKLLNKELMSLDEGLEKILEAWKVSRPMQAIG